MSQATRITVIVGLALGAGACVRLGHIQETQPVRTMQFTGSPKEVAQCVHRRLGGKVQEEAFGERYVIYDSAKSHQAEGMTHYAITIGRAAADKSFAEWRIMRPAQQAGTARQGIPPLSHNMIELYWRPVQECAKQGQAPQ